MWCDHGIVDRMRRLEFNVHPELPGVRRTHCRRARGAPLPILHREHLAMQRHMQVLREESWRCQQILAHVRLGWGLGRDPNTKRVPARCTMCTHAQSSPLELHACVCSGDSRVGQPSQKARAHHHRRGRSGGRQETSALAVGRGAALGDDGAMGVDRMEEHLHDTAGAARANRVEGGSHP
eukprot:4714721-Prymnesium_polylepis.2